MADIPSYRLSDIKRLNTDQLKQLKCCEIISDGEYIGTLLIPATDYIKLTAENMGQLSNSVHGKSLEEVTGVESAAV